MQKRGVDAIFRHECALRKALCRALADSEVECFTGAAQSGVLSMQRRGEDSEQTAQRLAAAGICVRAGLHCAPLAHESAGTLERGTVRLSVSAFNTAREIAQAAAILKK